MVSIVGMILLECRRKAIVTCPVGIEWFWGCDLGLPKSIRMVYMEWVWLLVVTGVLLLVIVIQFLNQIRDMGQN